LGKQAKPSVIAFKNIFESKLLSLSDSFNQKRFVYVFLIVHYIAGSGSTKALPVLTFKPYLWKHESILLIKPAFMPRGKRVGISQA
jgi:hypothetical protein